jgi:poly-gamma-glutamate capsule biosynthesis protein CapA/YwtB (metallophosphatase superfamily)
MLSPMRERFGFWLVIGLIVTFTWTSTSAAPARTTASSTLPPKTAPLTLPSSTPTGPPPFVPRHFTVLGAGDILLHPGLWTQGLRDAQARGKNGYDFDPIFASATPRIQAADLAICHMETPYGPDGGPYTGFPVFAVPSSIARTIHDVGYDTCSTASNHSLDDGEKGIDRTLSALDRAGVKHSGTARTPAEAATPDILDVNGVKVAQLSYAYGFNGIPLPRSKPWLANLINVPKILADAHRAKQAGADVVIVSLHFGTQYQERPNPQQIAVATALLNSPDVDLILGCHVHIVQPFQKINGKWVVYGMGNQIATQGFSTPTMDGVMPEFTFTETTPGHFKVTKAEAIPTFDQLNRGPIRLIDLPAELAKPNLSPSLRALYQASWNRTKRAVDSSGAAKSGLIVVSP